MSGPLLAAFTATLPFALDPFQQRACAAVEAGRGVLVAAPTGAGKTLVGEFAVHAALAAGRKAFYTTPIKALSNQKHADLSRVHGAERVGLLTGDASVNGEAPVVVMTTEVLRNMLYSGSPTLAGLGVVVMDEVHYLADRFRGAVWEEVIIHLPADVLVVSLSATVSNAEEFGEWLGTVRGPVDVVVSEQRPVPLWQQMLVGRTLYDLFEASSDAAAPVSVNRALLTRVRAEERPAASEWAGGRDLRRARSPGRGGPSASRAEVVLTLERAGLLPAITFVFSRQGCEAAVSQLLATSLRLVSDDEGAANRRFLESRVADLSDEDLAVLGYWDLADGVSRGFAPHHAGMLPTFREVVEALFTAGRLRAVFATETLALGINMPARTVVLERLVKFNGQTHADITPAEYTQLTGRAGRRGIDVEGYAVVLWRRGLDPSAVGGLASTRTYPLRSSFAPTYNMAVNLVARVGRLNARTVLESSFAQFQADRAVVGLARILQRNERAMREDAERMTCQRGDFAEYAKLREQLGQLEKDRSRSRASAERADAEESLTRLRVGDVIRVPTGRRAGHAVVVAAAPAGQRPLVRVVTEDKRLRRLAAPDLPGPVEALTTLRIPRGFDARNPRARRDLAARLRTSAAALATPGGRRSRRTETPDDEQVGELRRLLRAHPCHRCPHRDEHAHWAQRWWRLRRESDRLRAQVDGRTGSVARTFDRICSVLTELGYLDPTGTALTPSGQRLRTLYTERDLLAAECLRRGLWERLDPPALAAVVATLVHEPRREQDEDPAPAPTAEVAAAVLAMARVHEQLAALERAHGLTPAAAPSPGLAPLVHRWASGRSLEAVLGGSPMAAGDFVRRCKQVVDVLGQLAHSATDPALAASARQAARAVMRGVVAADRLD